MMIFFRSKLRHGRPAYDLQFYVNYEKLFLLVLIIP